MTRGRSWTVDRWAGVALLVLAFVVGCLAAWTPVHGAQLVLSWTAIVAAFGAGLLIAEGGAS